MPLPRNCLMNLFQIDLVLVLALGILAELLSGVPGIPPTAPPPEETAQGSTVPPSMSPVRLPCGAIAGEAQCSCPICSGHAPAEGDTMEDEW